MISIIIPVYNQTSELDKCLESIKEQTYSNFEVIVVNDRSTMRMSGVILKWKKYFGHKMEFINCQTHHGAPYARNRGYKKSHGEYLLFLDADSILVPEALEIFLDALRTDKKASYAYSSHKFGFKLFRSFPFDPEKLKKMPYIHTSALIHRSDFPPNGWDEDLEKFQDWDIWLTILEAGKEGVWIDKVLFKVKSGGSMSAWLPSFAYKLLPFHPRARKYKEAMETIKEKHGLS